MSDDLVTSLHPFGLGRLELAAEREAGPLWIRGVVLASTGPVDGAVIVEGGIVAGVASGSEPPPSGARVLETGGVVCPGFVDVHNHLPYAVFPRWTPARTFQSRFDWRGKMRCGFVVNPEPDPTYQQRVAAPFRALRQAGLVPRLVAHGLVRALLGGTTTALVDADLEPADLSLPAYAGLVEDPARRGAPVLGLLDAPCLVGPALTACRGALAAGTKLFVHVGEGADGVSRGEFPTLAARGLLTANTVLVHGLALSRAEWERVGASGASVAWSPSSNLRLYGKTLDVAALRAFGIRVAIAPDWSLTGGSTMLDEVVAVQRRNPSLDPMALLEMATRIPADLIGRPDLGAIAPGAAADLVVIGRAPERTADAAAVVTHASVADVRLVMVGGRPRYGSPDLLAGFAGGEDLSFDVDERRVVRRLRLEGGESLAAMRAALEDALAANAPGVHIAPVWEEAEDAGA